MAEGAETFSYTVDRKPERELQGVREVTNEFVEFASSFKPLVMEGFNIKQIFEERWKDVPLADIKPLAVNPNVGGERTSFEPARPVGEGFMATPVITNTVLIDQSRAWLFVDRSPDGDEKKTMLKGTGTRWYLAENPDDIASQFNQFKSKLDVRGAERTGWGSIGGVLEANVILEYKSSYQLMELYKRIFDEDPLIRAPRRVFETTDALISEGADKDIRRHFQIEYPLRTEVRAEYAYYLSDPAKLWSGLDLETDSGKQEAVKRVNAILTAYPKVNGYKSLSELTLEDVEPVIEACKTYNGLYESKTPIHSTRYGFNKRFGRMRYTLAKAGNGLAQTFFERNSEAVVESVKREVEKLGKMVGMTTALGVELRTSVSPKDAYGGEIADFDVVNMQPKKPEEIERFYVDSATIMGLNNVLLLSALMGCPADIQVEVLDDYLKNINLGFVKTLEKINQIGLEDKYQAAVKSYLQAVGKVIAERRDEGGLFASVTDAKDMDKTMLFLLPFAANADLMNTISGTSLDKKTSLAHVILTPRMFFGYETEDHDKPDDPGVEDFSTEEDYVSLVTFAVKGECGVIKKS